MLRRALLLLRDSLERKVSAWPNEMEASEMLRSAMEHDKNKKIVEANLPKNVCIENYSSAEDIDASNLQILLNKGEVSDLSAEEFISIDDGILTEVPINNVNDIIQRYTNKDSTDDDECNINENISDKELSIKSYGSFLDTVPELEKFVISQGDSEMLELLKNTRILKEQSIIHEKICTENKVGLF
ncbi:hypothetical protein AVEN_30022-1 [Araneus ventricosus]|uniref:Uncharacterized protein n=1 Tax=Araneus ventricosus TaxID=182803 RepID=A0A4Y2DV63_ARAVE|nr:hypothetical protein AVEN_30022-1 [Araneus ventricosus]